MFSLYEISILSFLIGLGTTFCTSVLGIAISVFLLRHNFRGKFILLILLRSLMGVPSVILGLIFFLLFSRFGYLGFFDILYQPVSIVIAQTFLILPMMICFLHDIMSRRRDELVDFLHVLPISFFASTMTYLYECRLSFLTLILAAFGRSISEVGIVSLVGGNIKGATRVLTTSIVLETQSGRFNNALRLGLVLLLLVLGVNILVSFLTHFLGVNRERL